MARYEISNEVRPLDRLITGFASSCGYEIQTVFNDLLRFIIHGFSPGAPPISNWKYKHQQKRLVHGNDSRMDTYYAETNRQVVLVRRFR